MASGQRRTAAGCPTGAATPFVRPEGEQETAWVLRAVATYSSRRYEGDLNDLVTGLDVLDPFGQLPVRISNSRLDGFLDFFFKKDCPLGCAGCTHCEEWSRRVISLNGDVQRYATGVERFLRRFTSGAFRGPLTHA